MACYCMNRRKSTIGFTTSLTNTPMYVTKTRINEVYCCILDSAFYSGFTQGPCRGITQHRSDSTIFHSMYRTALENVIKETYKIHFYAVMFRARGGAVS